MSANAEAGARGEQAAADFLKARQGYAVIARNWRSPRDQRDEIDLVCRDGDTLVFVEVRMRRSASHGGAVESITPKKRWRLVAAANGYLAMLGREPPCRFDAILLRALDPSTIEWRRNVIDE